MTDSTPATAATCGIEWCDKPAEPDSEWCLVHMATATLIHREVTEHGSAPHEHEWRDSGFATVEDCECGATRSGDIVIPADVSPPERR